MPRPAILRSLPIFASDVSPGHESINTSSRTPRFPEHGRRSARPQQPRSLNESSGAEATDWDTLSDATKHLRHSFHRLACDLKCANIFDTAVRRRSRRCKLGGLSWYRVHMSNVRLSRIRLERGKNHPLPPHDKLPNFVLKLDRYSRAERFCHNGRNNPLRPHSSSP